MNRERDIALVRAALESARYWMIRHGMALQSAAMLIDLDPAAIVEGVPEFSIAAGFRHVPEDVHALVLAERDALRARVEELENMIRDLCIRHPDTCQCRHCKAVFAQEIEP